MNNDTNNQNNNSNVNLNGEVLGTELPNNSNQVMQPATSQVPNSNPEVLDNSLNNNPSGFTVMLNDQNTTPEPPKVEESPASEVLTPNPIPQEPKPAYTNPQTIMPGPMPGFEDSSVVGQTPPISLNEEKQPKKKNNKIAFIIVIIGLILAVGGGVYYLLTNTDLLNKTEVTINTKSFNVEIGESLPDAFDNYAVVTGTESGNCQKDVSQVNINAEGVYEFTISCGSVQKKGTITVLDNRPLNVDTKNIYIVKGETVEAKDFALTPDNSLTYEFTSDISSLINTVGTHKISIKATNQTNNKTGDFEAKLIVLEYSIKGYLTCLITNTDSVSDTIKNQKIKYRFVISDASDSETNVYGGLTQELYEFEMTDQESFDNLLNEFNTNKTITIGGISGTISNVEFNASTKTITITNELDNNVLNNQYGADIMKTYSSIRNKFNTKDENNNNTCEWKKLEN